VLLIAACILAARNLDAVGREEFSGVGVCDG